MISKAFGFIESIPKMRLSLLFALVSICLGVSVEDCLAVNRRNLVQTVDQEILEDHCSALVSTLKKHVWTESFRENAELILNDVAPFTVLTEPPFVNPEKRQLLAAYLDHIAATSDCDNVACIALALNDRIWSVRDPPIVFEAAKANALNSYGVEETWERGNGSCTSMSVFLITGLRMLGVPSRLVGTPHWNLGPSKCPLGDASPDCGNHNWVEVYVPGKGWSFIDQRRPDQQVLPLNSSWFYPDWTSGLDGTGNHSVYAVSFQNTDSLGNQYPVGKGVVKADHFPMVWDWTDTRIHGWDMSAAYKPHRIGHSPPEIKSE